jgi:hypothetical protein
MKIVNRKPEMTFEDDNPLPAEEDQHHTHQLVATVASDKGGALARPRSP